MTKDYKVIPDAAVEAAAEVLWHGVPQFPHRRGQLRAALEAAAPHIIAAQQALIGRVEALCTEEDARQTAKAYAAVDAIRAALRHTP